MNATINEITQSITEKLSFDECSMDELLQLTKRFPFFGPAQFLLVQKIKQDNSPLINEHIQKTSLYFQNPVWFDHILNDTGVDQNYTVIKKEEPELPVALPTFKFEPIDPAKAELSFEPYHTIDYFASQGIRAKEEEKPKDQLSRQLKSFTEWLKAMKRLPASEIVATISTSDEKKIENMATNSISDREVVTAAMAEVWEKQGNHAKATEIYRKLSLLDPAKSAYFATKIEQLKNL